MMRRIARGEYANGRYRVVNRWGDQPGWTLLWIALDGTANVMSTHRTLRDARTEIARHPARKFRVPA